MKIFVIAIALATTVRALSLPDDDGNQFCDKRKKEAYYSDNQQQDVEYYSECIKNVGEDDVFSLIELTFRRACACLNVIEEIEDTDKCEELFLQAIGDFSYVTANAAQSSRCGQAAALFLQFYHLLLAVENSTEQDLDDAFTLLHDRWLQDLIKEHEIRGEDLRVKVMQKCEEDRGLFEVFKEQALIRTLEPELIFGYEVPIAFVMHGVGRDEDGAPVLHCSTTVLRDGEETKLDWEF